MPVTYPLALYRGDSYRWRFRFWNDAAKTQPADLTGVTAVSAKIDGAAGPVVLATTVVPPNEVTMTLDPDGWAAVPALAAGLYRWDLQFIFDDGQKKTQITGPVSVNADIVDAVVSPGVRNG